MLRNPSLLLMALALLPWTAALPAAGGRTSNDARLQRWLERFPDADANRDGVLTASEAKSYRQKMQARARARRQRGKPLPPTDFSNVHYGPHRLQAFDLWRAKRDVPTPVVLYIHGGGFRGGDKRSLSPKFLEQCLNRGFSVAAVNYRLIPEVTFPAPMHDSARAIQLLRHNAKTWNLDPTHFASTGGSAGGGISLWLAFHDDLAKPKSDDPIARQSTRLTCVAVNGAQSSYDPRFAKRIGLGQLLEHPSFLPFYGLKPDEIDTPRAHKLYEEASPIAHASPDDPPVLMDYSVPNEPVGENTPRGAAVHHPKFGLALKQRLDSLGIECIVQYPGSAQTKRIEKIDFIARNFAGARTRPAR